MSESNAVESGKSASVAEHKAKAAATGPVPVAIVTVSDSRTPETDVNGQYLRAAITAVGHVVVDYRLIRDEPEEVTAALLDERILLSFRGIGQTYGAFIN